MWIINLKIKVRIGKEYQQTGSTVTRPHVTQFTAHASLVAENHLHWWSLASASFFQQGFVVFWWWSCVFGHYSDVGWFQFLSFEDLMRLFVDISWLIVKMCELTTYLLFFVRFCSAVIALLSCEQQQRQAVVCQHFRTPGITSCPDISLWSLLLLQWAAPTQNLTGFPSE